MVDSPRVWSSSITRSPPSSSQSPPAPIHESSSYNSKTILPLQHMATDNLSRTHLSNESPYGPGSGPSPQGIPLQGPASHPDGPRDYSLSQTPPHLQYSISSSSTDPSAHASNIAVLSNTNGRSSPKDTMFLTANATDIYSRQDMAPSPNSATELPAPSHQVGGPGANHYPTSAGVPRLPPILQVEKQQVTTSATQLASASRRRNEAHFVCPVPGCGSTFTRRFNLRGESMLA
ncbi:hypothetical protein AX16_005206 [Volvariella volvacea WC 439]|nr:hypothetical protein AX16_005206 [Volvariella volvacea WC 439]